MTWQIEFDDRARRELRKLNKNAQAKILGYLDERIAHCTNPREYGKALKSNLKGLWRYRVEDYRIICRIEDNKISIKLLSY